MHSSDSPLVQPLLTSWRPAWQLIWSGDLRHSKRTRYPLGHRDQLRWMTCYISEFYLFTVLFLTLLTGEWRKLKMKLEINLSETIQSVTTSTAEPQLTIAHIFLTFQLNTVILVSSNTICQLCMSLLNHWESSVCYWFKYLFLPPNLGGILTMIVNIFTGTLAPQVLFKKESQMCRLLDWLNLGFKILQKYCLVFLTVYWRQKHGYGP